MTNGKKILSGNKSFDFLYSRVYSLIWYNGYSISLWRSLNSTRTRLGQTWSAFSEESQHDSTLTFRLNSKLRVVVWRHSSRSAGASFCTLKTKDCFTGRPFWCCSCSTPPLRGGTDTFIAHLWLSGVWHTASTQGVSPDDLVDVWTKGNWPWEAPRESSAWPGLSSFYCGGLGPAVRLAPCELGTLSPRRGRWRQGRGRKSQSDESLYWWPSRVEGNGEVLLGRQQTDQFANVLWSLEGHTVFWEISPCSLGMVSSSSFLPH